MRKVMLGFAAALFIGCAFVSAARGGEALDQLQNMGNTGTTFDGSDGARSGMDIYVNPTAGNPPEPTPTPVDEGNYQVDNSSATQNTNYSVDTSSTTTTTETPASQPAQDSGSETKSGTEVVDE